MPLDALFGHTSLSPPSPADGEACQWECQRIAGIRPTIPDLRVAIAPPWLQLSARLSYSLVTGARRADRSAKGIAKRGGR